MAVHLCIYRYSQTYSLLGIALEMNVSLPKAVSCTNFARSIHNQNTKSSVGTSFIRASVIPFYIFRMVEQQNRTPGYQSLRSAPTLRAAAVGNQTPLIKNAAHHDVDLPQGGHRFENHRASCRWGSSVMATLCKGKS